MEGYFWAHIRAGASITNIISAQHMDLWTKGQTFYFYKLCCKSIKNRILFSSVNSCWGFVGSMLHILLEMKCVHSYKTTANKKCAPCSLNIVSSHWYMTSYSLQSLKWNMIRLEILKNTPHLGHGDHMIECLTAGKYARQLRTSWFYVRDYT